MDFGGFETKLFYVSSYDVKYEKIGFKEKK